MGLGLAAMAVLATFVAIWLATSFGTQLRSHASDAPLTDGGSSVSLVGSLEQR